MSRFQIEIVNVGPKVFTSTEKNGYNSIEIAYKSGGKIMGKTVRDFAEKSAFNILLSAIPGTFYEIEAEKNTKGYIQWKNAEQVSASNIQNSDTQPASGSSIPNESGTVTKHSPSGGRVTGSNYETPEERATKQAIIVRQFSFNAATEAAKILGGNPENGSGVLELSELFTYARAIEDFVYTGVGARAESIRAVVNQLKN